MFHHYIKVLRLQLIATLQHGPRGKVGGETKMKDEKATHTRAYIPTHLAGTSHLAARNMKVIHINPLVVRSRTRMIEQEATKRTERSST